MSGGLLIRNLPEWLKPALRRRAAARGRSVEAEARAILEEAIAANEDFVSWWLDEMASVPPGLPGGRRRDFLVIRIEGLITRARERSYGYDEQAARALPTIMAARKRIGREVSKPVDVMIAAVAASRGMAIATRNTTDFAGMGVELIDPWKMP
jgi:hypothetical protein